jgi:3',5'-cyclic AMP phosphodiesterase CpdA
MRCTIVFSASLALSPLSCNEETDADTEGDSSGQTDSDGTGATDTSTPSATETGTTGELPEPLPPLDGVPLTTEETIAPVHPIEPEPTLDPRIPADMDTLLADGYGEVEVGPGEQVMVRTLDGSDPPDIGANPRLLTRFVHLADAQLVDDESPARIVNLDNDEAFAGSFRPHEANGCAILNAAIRTTNAVHLERPLDFVLLGGDNIDNAQENELAWLQAILEGDPVVHCDSGEDNDPMPGPDNDPKDPMAPVGLDVPWLWVNGNHDLLYQGNLTIESQGGKATGTDASGGTRDWSLPGGPVVEEVVADARRRQMSLAELLEAVAGNGDGHGIDAEVIAFGRAYYVFDVGDTLRVIVVDSAADTGGMAGVIHQADVDAFLRPALDQASTDGRLVIVTAHHGSGSITDGGGLGGTVQDDAITEEEWEGLLGEYDNIMMLLAGHSHVHLARPVTPPGGSPYWEVKTPALVDPPHQLRLIEIHDQDNGYLTITAIAFDFSTDGDDLAADGRDRAIVDLTSAWIQSGAGDLEDRNVQLWVPKP